MKTITHTQPVPAEQYQDIVDSIMQHARAVTTGHARPARQITAAIDQAMIQLQLLRLEYTNLAQ